MDLPVVSLAGLVSKDLAGFRRNLLAHFAACLALGRELHRLFALDLGVEESFFTRHLTNPIATLRLLRYPAGPGDDARHDAGAGTHTGYGNVTLFATDGAAGLEVASRSGEWIDVPSVAGAFVCNIGD